MIIYRYFGNRAIALPSYTKNSDRYPRRSHRYHVESKNWFYEM
ncbi:MAG: hypothetical protein VKL60_03985 [Sphaerospermopsis sp.]|nr:hypothetical protein [Sphaerospermopsis sp.]